MAPRKWLRATLFFATIALTGFAPGAAAAATYYVATTGNDASSGTATSPFRTIGRAYSLTVAGDTIIVKPGVYTDHTQGYGLRLNRSGQSGAPITLRSETRGAAVIDAQHNSTRASVIWISGNYNVVEGFTIRNSYKTGVDVYGSYNQLRHNSIEYNGSKFDPASTNGASGVYSDRNTRGTVYWGNHVHHNGRLSLDSNYDHGLYVTGDDEVVANNIIAHNSAYGLHVAGYQTVSNLKVYNNVLAWNGRSGGIVWLSVSGADIRNNTFYRNRKYAIDSYDAHGSGVNIVNNTAYGNGAGVLRMNASGSDISYNLSSMNTHNPLFVNDTQDFRLQSSSPDIDRGVTVQGVNADFAGTPRPQGDRFDIGAYELPVSGTPTPPAAPTNVRVISGG